jgi:predicted secreted acid phosphatase
VLDIDDTVLDNYAFLKSIDFARSAQPWTLHFLSAEAPAVPHMRELLLELRKRGYRIFFITGRWERFRDATAENLRKVGIERYERIIMLPDGKKVSSMIPFKSSSRRALIREGCDIILNIGDQESDLAGGYSRKCIKLPNPMYYTP